MEDTNLSKSLYRAVLKALGSKEDNEQAVNHIVRDIEDPNMQAQVPDEEVPATKEGVLHKDVSVSEMHQQKQAAAEAAVGMRPGQQKPAMKKMNYAAMMGMSEDAKDPGCVRGIDKLRKFMEKSSMKKAQKGVHMADTSHGPGVSSSGLQARQKLPRPMQSAKQGHERKLKELKAMPKPNLPKSEEMDKAIPAPAAPPVPASAKRILSRPAMPKPAPRPGTMMMSEKSSNKEKKTRS